jgi:radical SAM protein with 4Fe4S-binding SPASM domain
VGRRYYLPEDQRNPLTRARDALFRKPFPDFPKTIVIETIYGCNAGCVFCSYPELSKDPTIPKGRMSDAVFEKISRDCAGRDVERFILCFDNEPLLDKTLASRFAALKRDCPNARRNLTTNASLLDDRRFDELVAGGLADEVFLSVNGDTKETYEALMKLPYEKVFANLDNFCRRLRAAPELKKRLRVRFNVVQTGTVAAELTAMKKRWSAEEGFELHVIVPDNRGGDVDLGKLEKSGTKSSKFSPNLKCRRPFHTMAITWEGDAVWCCADYRREVKLGNVRDRSIADLWTGSPAAELRREFMTGDYANLPICVNCRICG